jgi:hypothetical protein
MVYTHESVRRAWALGYDVKELSLSRRGLRDATQCSGQTAHEYIERVLVITPGQGNSSPLWDDDLPGKSLLCSEDPDLLVQMGPNNTSPYCEGWADLGMQLSDGIAMDCRTGFL